MIGCLPETLTINGREIPINTDYRRALTVFEAFDDPDLDKNDKVYVMLDCIIGIEKLKPEEYAEAVEKVALYLDGGHDYSDDPKKRKIMDWQQDEQLVFSAVNDVAGYETRQAKYIHWWTFLGYFNEIKEGLFSQVLLIRQKKSKGQKLDKSEQEFYRLNQSIIDIKPRYTKEEQEEVDYWNSILPD